MIPEGLDHIAIGVTDLESSVKWYSEVIGLKKLTKTEWGRVPVMMLAANNSGIALFESEPNIRDPQRNLPHIAFVVSPERFNAYRDHFREIGVPCKEEDHTPALSLFVRDPDNYPVEITTYLG